MEVIACNCCPHQMPQVRRRGTQSNHWWDRLRCTACVLSLIPFALSSKLSAPDPQRSNHSGEHTELCNQTWKQIVVQWNMWIKSNHIDSRCFKIIRPFIKIIECYLLLFVFICLLCCSPWRFRNHLLVHVGSVARQLTNNLWTYDLPNSKHINRA